MLGTLKFMLFDIVANLHKLVNKEPYRKVNVLSEKLKNHMSLRFFLNSACCFVHSSNTLISSMI